MSDQPSGTAAAPKRALLVDDEADLRHFVSQVLSHAGYAVDVAHDGADALEKIAKQAPDLIVLDLMMPVVDGFTVLAQLDKDDSRVPVVVLSAQPDPPRVRNLYKGVKAVLSKPFRIPELLAACASAVGAGS